MSAIAENQAAHPGVAGDDLQQEILARIERRSATYFPSLAGVRAPEVVCRRRSDSHGFSVLLEYDVIFAGIETKHIFAKVRRDSRFGPYRREDVTRAPALLQREFEELSKADRYFRGRADGLGVVRPLDYWDELNTVLIEKASGCDLEILARSDEAASLRAFTRCGQWLRAFHQDVHEPQTRVWDPEACRQRLVARRDKLAALGVPATGLDRLLRRAIDAARVSPQREVPCSVLHGDYKLRHIWATPDGIQVFDFGNVHAGDCYADIALFLVELSVLRLGNPWFQSRKAGRYAEAFLGGYFPAEPPPLVGLYVVEALLKKWRRRLRRWSKATMAATLQTCARRMGAAPVVDRWYVDRWFAARIEESLGAVVFGGNPAVERHG